MKKRTEFACFALIFAGIVLTALPCGARDPGHEKIGDFGSIDWVGQKIIAAGYGSPPEKINNKAQAKLMARRAAVVDARRNLLEVVKGVSIDSATTAKDFMVQDDTIVSKVNGALQYSVIEGYEYSDDGIVTATVSMQFSEQLGEILISAEEQTRVETSATNPAPDDMESRIRRLEEMVEVLTRRLGDLETPASQPVTTAEDKKSSAELPPYTGLVIDARHTGFKPCLKPEIFGRNQLVYPGEYVSSNKAVRNGYVRFYRKMGQAQQSASAGSLPFTIKALSICEGQRGLNIGPEDYDSLKAIIETPENFMSNCRVVIVF